MKEKIQIVNVEQDSWYACFLGEIFTVEGFTNKNNQSSFIVKHNGAWKQIKIEDTLKLKNVYKRNTKLYIQYDISDILPREVLMYNGWKFSNKTLLIRLDAPNCYDLVPIKYFNEKYTHVKYTTVDPRLEKLILNEIKLDIMQK